MLPSQSETEKQLLSFTDDAIFKSTTYVTVNKSKFASPSLFEFPMKFALSSSLFSKQKHKQLNLLLRRANYKTTIHHGIGFEEICQRS